MKLVVAGKDISALVGEIKWSGDTKSVARTLNFTVARSRSDKLLPKVSISEGDFVRMSNAAGQQKFWGVVFDVDRTAAGNTVSYMAYDLLFYILTNKTSRVLEGTPESITAEICAEFGVPLKQAQETGVAVYYPCFDKTGYEAIMIAYSEAYRQNSGKYGYIPLMDCDALTVIPLGMDCGVVLDPAKNLTEANYKTSATKVVNRVPIVDKDGNMVGEVTDEASRAKYGTLAPELVKQEEGVDAYAEAAKKLTGIEQVASASGLSDDRAVAGWSVLLREPETGLVGRFTVTGDTHTYTNGSGTMELTLAFENLMDEMDMPTETQDKEG